MRKFARVILVLALVLGVSVSAFAAGAPKRQTISISWVRSAF